jgi:hypothetical protein
MARDLSPDYLQAYTKEKAYVNAGHELGILEGNKSINEKAQVVKVPHVQSIFLQHS